MKQLAPLKNQKGQFVIEAILLMTLLVGIMVLITSEIRDRGLLNQLVVGPWQKIAGMSEFGVWAEPTPGNKKLHPNTYNRVFTPDEN